MKTCLALVLALAACSHKSDSKTPASPNGADDTAMVDPTLPSWAPKSCSAYHVLVVKAVDCAEIDQGARDSIKAKYETQNTEWHNLTNAPPERLTEIGAECDSDKEAVHTVAAGKCGIAGGGVTSQR